MLKMKENYISNKKTIFNKGSLAVAMLSLFSCFTSQVYASYSGIDGDKPITALAAPYYWQVSAITGISGGNTYSLNAPASPITISINQCAGGIEQPHNSTLYNITWYRNTINSTVGGTQVASSVVGTPYTFNTTQSYTPSTNIAGTYYYYAVLSNPSKTTCGFTGTLTSPTTAVTVAGPAAALNFDGVDDYVNVGNSLTSALNGSNKISVEAWVKPENLNNIGVIIGNYSTNTNGNLQFLLRRWGSEYYEFWIGNGNYWEQVTSNVAPVANVWQHVTGTWDGTTAKIFVNGTLAGSINTVISNLSNGNDVWIGANNINEIFSGNIDEVRVWNRSLCQSEIQNNMNGEILTSANGLLANYHFNQGLDNGNNSGITILNDASGNAYNGALTNFTLNGTTSNWLAPGAVASGVSVPAFSNLITSSITNQTNVSCFGGSNGSATVAGSGNGTLTYVWAPVGGNTATASGLTAGNYSCTVTNECGATTSQNITILQPSELVATIGSQQNITCFNGNDGNATINVTGGTGNYTFNWSPNVGSSSTISNLTEGTYNAIITDANGCSTSKNVTLVQPGAISAVSYITICGNQSYSIGTNTYTTSGIYTDVLTNANGCDSTVTTHLTVNPTYNLVDTITIEAGQSAMIGGINRTVAGNYPTLYATVNGCDSTITTTLNVLAMASPSNLIATPVSQTQINLAWTDNTQNELGYIIERALTANGTFEQIGFTNQNEVTLSDLDLTVNTNYCYRVVAINANGVYSAYSPVVCASTFPVIIPAASNLVATTLSQTSIQLNWNDNSTTEYGFIIVGEVNGQGFATIDTVGTDVTTFVNNGLIPNTTYNYKVIAYSLGGNAPASNVATSLTFDNYAAAATNLTATAISNVDVQLNWNDVATNELAYIVQRSTTSGAGFVTIATLPANSVAFNDIENLTANNTYFYQVLASNTGGSVPSNEASVSTIGANGYAMDSVFMNCRDAEFCMPINLNHTISGAIGFDFTVDYDTANFDFNGISIDANTINPAYTEYSSFVNADGTVKVLVNILGSAPANTSFNGNGALFCLNFTKHLDYEQGESVFSIGNVLESYPSNTILQSISNGIVTVEKDTLAPGTLRTWNNNNVMSYNAANQNQFLVTKIYGSNNTNTVQSTNFVTPNINGEFSHNIYDGDYIKIVRDIAPTSVLMPFVNGSDVVKVKKIALSDASFIPNVYQVIAADVNMDGKVTAGDVTLVKQRSTLTIGQFPQAWNTLNGEASKDWLFVDSLTIVSDPSYQISATYPAFDGTGFNKNHVPQVALTLPVAVDYTGNCPEFTTSQYRGILLGDVDGNFNQIAAGGTKSMSTNSMSFEIANAIQNENCVIDIPFYTGELIGDDVYSVDFDMTYNNSQLEFVDVIYSNTTSTSEQLFNHIEGNRILFTSSDLNAYAPSTLMGYVRFNVLANQVSADDFGTVVSYINGTERNVSIEGLANCANYTGVKEIEETQTLNVYPNPHTNTFVVELNTTLDKNVEIYLTNVYGEIVQSIENGQVAGAYKTQVNTTELTSGVYFLTVKTNGKTIVKKLVKK